MSKRNPKSKKKDKPISLYPMEPEEALRRFMEIDPKEYEEYREQERKKRKGSKKG